MHYEIDIRHGFLCKNVHIFARLRLKVFDIVGILLLDPVILRSLILLVVIDVVGVDHVVSKAKFFCLVFVVAVVMLNQLYIFPLILSVEAN